MEEKKRHKKIPKKDKKAYVCLINSNFMFPFKTLQSLGFRKQNKCEETIKKIIFGFIGRITKRGNGRQKKDKKKFQKGQKGLCFPNKNGLILRFHLKISRVLAFHKTT